MGDRSLGEWRFLGPFLAVGILGFCLNMTVLTLALWAGVRVKLALSLGIAASTLCNFFFDRHLVFSYARRRALLPQFVGFLLVCLLGALLNYLCATALLWSFPWIFPQIAEWGGITVGTSFNYLVLRFLIFRNN